jgi:hypothetical protein
MLARYVLGGLSDRERERLEEEYFEDDEAFEQIMIAEEDLIDAYVRGELSAEERAQFEAHVLTSPQMRERVQFARALAGAVSDARPAGVASEAADVPRPGFIAALFGRGAALRLTFAAAAVVVVVFLAWFLFVRVRTREESQPVRAELTPTVEPTRESQPPATPEQAQVPTPPEVEPTRPTTNGGPQPSPGRSNNQIPRPSVASFVLTPGLVRGGGGATLQVPRNASSIALRLNVEANTHTSYRAVVETADRREVWRADSIAPPIAGGTLALPALPARDLPPGDYILLLSGKRPDGTFEGVADYSFRVVRR